MNDEQLVKQLGQIIRALRQTKNLSQEEFAAQCGLHRTYIGTIERGEKTMMIVTAAKIAQALNLSLAQLFQGLEEDTQL